MEFSSGRGGYGFGGDFGCSRGEHYGHRGGFDECNEQQVLLKPVLFFFLSFLCLSFFLLCVLWHCGLPPFVGFDSQKTFESPICIGHLLFVYLYILFIFFLFEQCIEISI